MLNIQHSTFNIEHSTFPFPRDELRDRPILENVNELPPLERTAKAPRPDRKSPCHLRRGGDDAAGAEEAADDGEQRRLKVMNDGDEIERRVFEIERHLLEIHDSHIEPRRGRRHHTRIDVDGDDVPSDTRQVDRVAPCPAREIERAAGRDERCGTNHELGWLHVAQWSVWVKLVPPGLVSTPWASLRLLSIVTAMLASARLAHVVDPCAIWYQFSQYTPLE